MKSEGKKAKNAKPGSRTNRKGLFDQIENQRRERERTHGEISPSRGAGFRKTGREGKEECKWRRDAKV